MYCLQQKFTARLLMWSESISVFKADSHIYKNNNKTANVSIYMQGWQLLSVYYCKNRPKRLTPIEKTCRDVLLPTVCIHPYQTHTEKNHWPSSLPSDCQLPPERNFNVFAADEELLIRSEGMD